MLLCSWNSLGTSAYTTTLYDMHLASESHLHEIHLYDILSGDTSESHLHEIHLYDILSGDT